MAGLLFKGLAWLLQRLPETVANAMAVLLGNLWYFVIPVRRQVMMMNLRIAFPDRDYRTLQRICRRTLISFMRNLVEFTRITKIDQAFVDNRVTTDGMEILEQAYARGRGIVVASGHLGNWEVMGAAAARLGYPITYIVKRVKDQRLDDLINGWRREVGLDIIYAREAGKEIVPHLQSGRILAFMIDQDAGKRGVWTDFFDQPASTPRGAAAYALRTGAPLLFMYDVRHPDGNHHVRMREVEIDREGEIDSERITQVMQTLTTCLEEAVRRYPEQYMWMHHRWRSWLRRQGRRA